MTRLLPLLCVLASLPAAAADSPSTLGTRPAPSVQQPVPDGGYEILGVGEATLHVRCDQGGWIFVSRRAEAAPAHAASAPRQSHDKRVTDERDAAIRAACRNVDYSR